MKSKKILELEKEIRRLKKLMATDELTGVLNRTGFKKETSRILNEVIFFKKKNQKKEGDQRKKFLIKDMALLFIDVDGLKKINDIYGHRTGDRLIKAIAKTIASNVRNTDFVGRWGGDEFVVALAGSSEEDGHKIAEIMREEAKNVAKSIGFGKVKITLSIGVAEVSEKLISGNGVLSVGELIEYADAAMYEAKIRRGRDNTARYSEIS